MDTRRKGKAKMTKPIHKMKTVVKALRTCLSSEMDICNECPYVGIANCGGKLAEDALYYLEQALEKSEGKK